MRATWAVAAAVVAVAVSGCTFRIPVPMPPTTTPAPHVTPAPSSPAPTTAAPGFVVQPLPWTDGGPMLWPVTTDDGTGDRSYGEGSSWALMRYAFLDAAGRMVQSARFTDYDYCLVNGRPASAVAIRPGAIDALTLDGVVTRTIPVPIDQSSGGQSVQCHDNKTVILFVSSEGQLDWKQAYDLATGAKLPDKKVPNPTLECAWDEQNSKVPMPKDYPDDAYGGWARNPDTNLYLNIETKAVVKPMTSKTSCGGTDGFLACWGGVVPVVYDKSGHLTEFADVNEPYLWCSQTVVSKSPYLWARAAAVEGFIDMTGTWLYQQPVHTALLD